MAELEKADAYRLLTHSIVPRPIAWVLSENDSGTFNLAPFSYFNVVCSDPALLMFSVGHKRDGSKKDTWANIERSKRCVVHIANMDLMGELNESARALDLNHSELEHMNVTLVESESFALPRIEQAPIAFDCLLHDLHLLGNGPQAVIYTEVVNAFVADELKLTERCTLDEKLLDPLARLGGDNYSSLGEIKSLQRPA